MSQTSGIPLAVFHRVGSIACGGLNTMPHDGAVVTYLSYCKISHKRGYFDMFIVAGAIPILPISLPSFWVPSASSDASDEIKIQDK